MDFEDLSGRAGAGKRRRSRPDVDAFDARNFKAREFADRAFAGRDFEEEEFDDPGFEAALRAEARHAAPPRRAGEKIREERRRATALMRLDDLDPVAERVFNDEFFTALRVQPRDLERAIRKARRRAEARDKNRMTPLKALGWSAWLGAVAASLFVVFAYKDVIVARFPGAAGAYQAFGVEAAPYGLKIETVNHRIAMSTSGPVIEISGVLVNVAAGSVRPPLLQAEAFDARGGLLSRWTFAPGADLVGRGEKALFSTRSPAPDGVAEVALSFAPKGAAADR